MAGQRGKLEQASQERGIVMEAGMKYCFKKEFVCVTGDRKCERRECFVISQESAAIKPGHY